MMSRMVAKRKAARRAGRQPILALILICGACAGAAAFASGFGIQNVSQTAAGNAADMQCMGGKDAMCQCMKGIDPKTGKCGNVKGGGKIECPCQDTTSGHVTSGKCEAVGKCKGEKTDGMMPMLPMLPMPMPKMSMPMMMMPMMPSCPPTNATSTTASTTKSDPFNPGQIYRPPAGTDPNCAQTGAQDTSGWYNNYTATPNPFASPDDTQTSNNQTTQDNQGTDTTSIWSRLMQSLGLGGNTDTGGDTTDTGTLAGQNTSSTTQLGARATTTGTTTVQTPRTVDFVNGGSTFSYSVEKPVETPGPAAVLAQLVQTLQRLLSIVLSWTKK